MPEGNKLRGKKILVISPQPWEKMKISKHHYAVLLQQRGNEVYFLEPPVESGEFKVEKNSEQISIVQYKPSFNTTLRFHFRKFYDFLMKRQVKKIIAGIGKPDIVWCFEPNLYTDLRWFGAQLNIYHVVDPVIFKHQFNVAKSADYVFAVSNKILSRVRPFSKNVFFINHGLNHSFSAFAQQKIAGELNGRNPGQINIGYFGNLLRAPLDKNVFIELIGRHPEMKFHFWGKSKYGDSASPEIKEFIDFLQSSSNVVLHGEKVPEQLCREISVIDVFLLSYRHMESESDLSNSHKILEYLSTGRAIVSSPIEEYLDKGLMQMPKANDAKQFVEVFENVIRDLNAFNDPAQMRKRIEYALSNTYEHCIEKIEKIVTAN